MKFKEGDAIISGPYLIKADGKAATPPDDHRDLSEGAKDSLSQISRERGPHMILGMVLNATESVMRVEARYLVWDNVVESVDGYNLTGTTFLPVGSTDYELTELFDREQDNTNRMIAFLQFAGQRTWCAENEPEEQI